MLLVWNPFEMENIMPQWLTSMQKKKSLDIRIHYDLTEYIVNIWAIVKKKTHNHKLLFLQHTAIILAQVFRNSTLAFYSMLLSLLLICWSMSFLRTCKTYSLISRSQLKAHFENMGGNESRQHGTNGYAERIMRKKQ